MDKIQYGPHIIFIDESGVTTINQSEKYYVITAIIINPESQEKVENSVSKIVKGTKSSKIGGNVKRRKLILKAIKSNMNAFNYSYYCLIVNKYRVYEDSGLQFKKSFYKYLHQKFFKDLLENLPYFNIIVDNYGGKEFMNGFKKYCSDKLNLYNSIEFGSPDEYPIIRVADLIAGSFRRAFQGDDSLDVLKEIDFPKYPFYIWPPSYNDRILQLSSIDEDNYIAQISLDCVRDFINKNYNTDVYDKKLQIITLELFLYKFYENPNRYTTRSEIVRDLEKYGYSISEHTLSTNVISNLRNEGIILTSTDSGIKLPVSMADINAWLNRAEIQTIPYLKKIIKVRDKILLRTNSKIDIFDFYKSIELNKIFKSLRNTN